MKKLMIQSLIALTSLPAFAGFDCQNGAESIVTKNVWAEEAGQPDTATAIYTKDGNVLKFTGTFEYTSSFLQSTTAYTLVGENGVPAKLTVVKTAVVGRGGCGRGGCDDLSLPEAVLEIGGEKSNLSCTAILD